MLARADRRHGRARFAGMLVESAALAIAISRTRTGDPAEVRLDVHRLVAGTRNLPATG
jgi:hypothetical protein